MITCIVPARGGSKGIPLKNIKHMAGKPLLYYSIREAQRSQVFDKIIVSTENELIKSEATICGALIHDRPDALAADNIHSIFVILDVIKNYKDEDVVVMLLPTSPLRTAKDIVEALQLFNKIKCDSVVSVVRINKPVSSFRYEINDYLSPVVPTTIFETQRQEAGDLYEVNGSIYISTVGNLRGQKSFHKGRVVAYKMKKLNSIDINDMDDWILAEKLLESR